MPKKKNKKIKANYFQYGNPMINQGLEAYVPQPAQGTVGPESGFDGQGALGGAAQGAALGAKLGTIVPGIGNLVGAGVGALAGGAMGGFMRHGGNMYQTGGPEGGPEDSLDSELIETADKFYKFGKTPEKRDSTLTQEYKKGSPEYTQIIQERIKNDPNSIQTRLYNLNYTPDVIYTGKQSNYHFDHYKKPINKKEIAHRLQQNLNRKEINSIPKLNPKQGTLGIHELNSNITLPERAPKPDFQLWRDSKGRPTNRSADIRRQQEVYKLLNQGYSPQEAEQKLGFNESFHDSITGKEIDSEKIKNYQNQQQTDRFVNTFMKNQTFRQGGKISNNSDYGSNNMNSIEVTNFGTGGTHEENPLGGIPQGIGQNGKPNLVEEGELKIQDPRSEGNYIISADKSMKITKKLAEEHGLPKKFAGKTVKQAADKILRKGSKREGDIIEDNSKNLDLIPLLNIHDQLTAEKEAEREAEFTEQLEELEQEYPEYMQALMESSTPQEQMSSEQMQEQMPQQGMEQMGMPQEMGMEAPEGMPPMEGMGMMRYGGKKYNLGGSLSTPPAYQNILNNIESGNHYSSPYKKMLAEMENKSSLGNQSLPESISSKQFQPLTAKEKQLEEMPETSVSQSPLNAAAQLLPPAYNIGMGLGTDTPIEAGRISRQELEKQTLGQAAVDAKQQTAGARRSLRNAGVGAGNYMANLSNLQQGADRNMAQMHTQLRNQNAQIANQQAGLDRQREQANIGLSLQEQQMQRQAERERQNMMAAGVSQLGQYAQAQQKDELGLAYANMYSPDFEFKYNKPFSNLLNK